MKKIKAKIIPLTLGILFLLNGTIFINNKNAIKVTAANVMDTIQASDLEATSTSLTAFSNVSKDSEAIYAGQTATTSKQKQIIQMGTPAHIYSSRPGGIISKVSVVWNSEKTIFHATKPRKIQIYGQNAIYPTNDTTSALTQSVGTLQYKTSETDTPQTEYTYSNNFLFAAVKGHSNGTFYLDSISFEWSPITAISLTTSPTKTEYSLGEPFLLDGTKLTFTSEDGKSAEVNDVNTLNELFTVDKTTFSTAGSQNVTLTYKANTSLNVTIPVTVSSRSLTSISVTVNPKLDYYVGEELDLTGMVVMNNYSDGTSEINTTYTTEPENKTVLEATHTKVLVKQAGVSDVELPLTISTYTGKVFNLASQNKTDLGGTYVAVYNPDSGSSYSFGNLDKTHAEKGSFVVDVTGNTLNGNVNSDKTLLEIEKVYDDSHTFLGYSLKALGGSNDGNYLSSVKNNADISFKTSPHPLSIELSASKADIKSTLVDAENSTTDEKYFRFNPTSNQMRFRWYAIDRQQNIKLFRLQESEATLNEAISFATEFKNRGICGDIVTEPDEASNTLWDEMWTSYKALSIEARALLANREHDNETAIRNFYTLYDKILLKAESRNKLNLFYDFLEGRYRSVSSRSSVISKNKPTSSATIFVFVLLFSSVSIAGGYYFIRKRQELNK